MQFNFDEWVQFLTCLRGFHPRFGIGLASISDLRQLAVMRRLMIDKHGSAPRLATAARPQPGPGEVVVEVAACGLNFADLLQIEGRYQERITPPYTPGMEISGRISALGAGVRTPAPGTRIAAYATHGGLADFTCLPAENCMIIPDSLSDIEAAGFLVAYGTSHLALHSRAALKEGETLLVLGAAGGVGLTAVEVGKKMGARVIACARGADKLNVAAEAGADHLIDSSAPDLRGAIKALGGADVVYDPVGGDLFTEALRATKPGGRILVIGFASGVIPPIPANIIMVKNISVLGFYWGGHLSFDPANFRASLRKVLAWQAEGALRPHVSHVLPLERSSEGLELLRQRKSTGKVVIDLRTGRAQ